MDTTNPPIIALQQNAGNAPTALSPLQQLLAPYTHEIILFWFSVWVVTALYLLYTLWHEYKNRDARE